MTPNFEVLAESWPYIDELHIGLWDIQAEQSIELAVAFEFEETANGDIRCTHMSVYNGQNESVPELTADLKAFLMATIDARIDSRRESYFEALVDKQGDDEYDNYIDLMLEERD